MKNKLLLFFSLLATTVYAQNGADCKTLIDALPKLQKYHQFKLISPANCAEGIVTTYYSIGSHDDQLLFSVMITDAKPIANQGVIGDITTKYEMAKTAKDKTAIKLSRFKLGTKGFVAHDVNTGIKRVYMYTCILKNRYVLDLRVNNDQLKNLDQFEDFIADYLSKFKEDLLPN